MSSSHASPVLSFSDVTYDFGKIPEGRTVSHEFLFTNTGDTSLRIVSFSLPAGCTIARYTSTPVGPGESGSVAVDFFTAGASAKNVTKTIAVFSSDVRHAPVYLNLTGEVVPPFLFSPADTSVFVGRSKVLEIRPNPEYSAAPPKVTNINTVGVIKTSMQLVHMDKPDWRVVLVLSAPPGPSVTGGTVRLSTNIPDLPLYIWNCAVLGRPNDD